MHRNRNPFSQQKGNSKLKLFYFYKGLLDVDSQGFFAYDLSRLLVRFMHIYVSSLSF